MQHSSFLLLVALATSVRAQTADTTRGVTAGGVSFEAVGRGAPIVFIHAFSMDRRMWDAQVTDLASRYRVVRYDLRSHGRSGGQ